MTNCCGLNKLWASLNDTTTETNRQKSHQHDLSHLDRYIAIKKYKVETSNHFKNGAKTEKLYE